MSSGRHLLTYHRTVLFSSSRLSSPGTVDCLTLKMEAIQSFKRSENFYLVTQHNISEDLCLHCPPLFFIHMCLYKMVLKHTWAFQPTSTVHSTKVLVYYISSEIITVYNTELSFTCLSVTMMTNIRQMNCRIVLRVSVSFMQLFVKWRLSRECDYNAKMHISAT